MKNKKLIIDFNIKHILKQNYNQLSKTQEKKNFIIDKVLQNCMSI